MVVSSSGQGLQVEPVELADLPYLLYRGGNRFTVTNGENHFCRAALHDLMHDECRQIVEQMHVIDTHHHRGARRCGRQRLDHPPQQLNGVGDTRRRPRRESTQRNCARRGCADRPTGLRTRADSAADKASRAMRLFPTPAAP